MTKPVNPKPVVTVDPNNPMVKTVTVNGVTVSINVEDAVFLTAETAISILLALSPIGVIALPAWALIILPMIKAELPLTEQLLNELAVVLKQNAEVNDVLKYLTSGIQRIEHAIFQKQSSNTMVSSDGQSEMPVWPPYTGDIK